MYHVYSLHAGLADVGIACRFRSLGKYPSWEPLLEEWKEGIRFTYGNKQTVPMEQLEKDLQEGVQYKSTAVSTSDKEPWRQGITDRNIIRDRKILIYGMLQAERDGLNLKEFMAGHVQKAEKAMKEASKLKGAPPSLLTFIKRQFEQAPNFKTPVQFEEQVLGWNLTAKVKKQAASKQANNTTSYPPPGIGAAAES